MFLVVVVEEILSQRASVAETLYNAVHVTCVTQVFQAGQAAFLKKVDVNEEKGNMKFTQ